MTAGARGFLLAIEGGDGAGKATAAAEVAAQLVAAGTSAVVLSFPRYADTLAGHVLGEHLGGRLPHAASPRAAAVLYALDRMESADAIAEASAQAEVVVFDRYIASNMAYQAAQTAEPEALMRWIERLEVDQFGLPAPDLNIYLDTPADVARGLILRKRRRSYTDDALDAYEADVGLQARVRDCYETMAQGAILAPWARVPTVADGALRPPRDIAAAIVTAFGKVRAR